MRSCIHQVVVRGASPARPPASFVRRLRAASADRRRPVRASSVRVLWLPRTRLGSRVSPYTRLGRGYYVLELSMSRMSAGKARRGSVLRLAWSQERRVGLLGCGE